MRRLLALFLLVLFAALATADTFACPDGCQTASSAAAADQCNASGRCVFCTGGIATHDPPLLIAPITSTSAADEVPQQEPAAQPALALDHPPRLI